MRPLLVIWTQENRETSLSGDTLKDGIPVDLINISGLDLSSNTDQFLADGILGGSVQHLSLDLGGIRSPDDEQDLVTGTLSAVKLEVVDGIAAIVGGELSNEVVVRGRLVTGLLNDNFSVIVVKTADDITGVLTELEGLVGLNYGISNSYSWGLIILIK